MGAVGSVILITMNKADQTKNKLRKLKSILRNKTTLLIVMQDNPDPDAIAASSALKELVNKTANISCQLAYGGTIGRAENHELVNYLGFNFHPFKDVDPMNFDLLALLDTQPGAGNNPLPADFSPDIVIDHHPIRPATRSITFTDIRKKYGAASTILWEYLSAAKITPEIPIATALLYGIRSDTQDLGRETIQAGDVISKIVDGIGTGGGHEMMAGGQIPLQAAENFTSERNRLELLIEDRFLEILGIKDKNGRNIVHV